MVPSVRSVARFVTLALVIGLSACTVSEQRAPDSAAVVTVPVADTPAAVAQPLDSQPSAGTPSASPAATSTQRLEVDLKARKVTLFENDKAAVTYPVAVGSEKWPTQTGSWTVSQVIFNPEWIPPDESWAEENTPKKPGAADNPLGRAQLIYDPPRTIHGTNKPSSIGTNVSHGSIRMNNDAIVALAKRILAANGEARDEAWYRDAATNRSEKKIINLPTGVPIRVF